jgi:hypothetical protein
MPEKTFLQKYWIILIGVFMLIGKLFIDLQIPLWCLLSLPVLGGGPDEEQGRRAGN